MVFLSEYAFHYIFADVPKQTNKKTFDEKRVPAEMPLANCVLKYHFEL